MRIPFLPLLAEATEKLLEFATAFCFCSALILIPICVQKHQRLEASWAKTIRTCDGVLEPHYLWILYVFLGWFSRIFILPQLASFVLILVALLAAVAGKYISLERVYFFLFAAQCLYMGGKCLWLASDSEETAKRASLRMIDFPPPMSGSF